MYAGKLHFIIRFEKMYLKINIVKCIVLIDKSAIMKLETVSMWNYRFITKSNANEKENGDFDVLQKSVIQICK